MVFLGDGGLICDNSRNLNLKKAFKETTVYNFINDDGFLTHVLLYKTLLIFDNFVLQTDMHTTFVNTFPSRLA